MRRQVLRQQTHDKLLDALLEAVRDSPGQPKVADVVQLAGLSPGTFYLHFASLGAALGELRLRVLLDLGAAAEPHTDLQLGIRAYLDRAFQRRADLNSLSRVAGLGPHQDPESSTEALASWIELRLADDGRGPEDRRYLAWTGATMIEAATLRELRHDDGGSARLSAAISTLLRGLRGSAQSDAGGDSGLRRSTKVALRVGDRALTFVELDDRVARARAVLRDSGLAKGDVLCLLLRNNLASVELTPAALRAGLVIVPMNTYWRSAEIGRVLHENLGDNTAACLAFHDESRSVLDGLDSGLLRRIALLPIGSAAAEERYEAALADAVADDSPPEESGTTVLYTSGSTDRPKGVLRTEGKDERRAHAQFLASVFGVTREDVVLVVGPLHHAANRMLLSVATHVGATTVLMERFEPEAFFGLVTKHNVTATFVVPTMLYRLVRTTAELRRGHDLSTLTRILHAGGPCSAELKRAALDLFAGGVYEFFGTTEFGGTFITPQEWLLQPGSVGRAWDDTTYIRIVDPDGADLPPEVVGRVAIGNTRRASFDYFEDGEVRKPDLLPDGAFLTGDLGRLDRKGYLYLADRRTAVIKTGGVPVYPSDIEAVIMEDRAVHDCVVVGLPDQEWGESVAAFVQPESGRDIDVERLRETLRARLAHYKCPRRWFVVDSIPRDEAGKIMHSEVASLMNSHQVGAI